MTLKRVWCICVYMKKRNPIATALADPVFRQRVKKARTKREPRDEKAQIREYDDE